MTLSDSTEIGAPRAPGRRSSTALAGAWLTSTRTLEHVKLGVVADIHGNLPALDAVLADARGLAIDQWWALGDLVLFGSRPVEVLDALASLPSIAYVSGNTDRYVVTGNQPRPHETPAHAVGDLDLVERYSAMAGAIGWTRGALAQGGRLSMLSHLPAEQRMLLPNGSAVLGIHASPRSDDGPGIDSTCDDGELRERLADAGARCVIGGHTHDPTDRQVGPIRALNAGSVGVPRHCGHASWLVIDAHDAELEVDLREVPFDIDATVRDLYDRGYPNAPFMESVLSGTRGFG
jgi:predicted phosphodiesterase